MSLRKYLKQVLPTSEETGLGEATTRSVNENVQKVLTERWRLASSKNLD